MKPCIKMKESVYQNKTESTAQEVFQTPNQFYELFDLSDSLTWRYLVIKLYGNNIESISRKRTDNCLCGNISLIPSATKIYTGS